MKVSLICTGGLSTNWIVAKIKDYAKEHDQEIEIQAFGIADYYPAVCDSDAVLLGPQIGYYQNEVQDKLGREVGVITPADYATANIGEILMAAKKLANKRSE
ncbi:MAG: hypothetical protein Q4A59_04740 [Erysipelotrichaceae bacterium]|nr:hypothetical protein [Erysipelotrichaceae bacterium]